MPRRALEVQARLDEISGLLPDEMALTLDSVVQRGEGSRAILAEARRMLAAPYGMLTLHGGPGNGKTLVLQALVNEFRQQGKAAIYVRLADLLDHLRDGFDPDVKIDTSRRYQELSQVTLLALDEFDKPRLTDYAREVIFTLVDDRYRYGKQSGRVRRHTVIAMNCQPDTLPAYLISRLRYDLHGPDGFRIIENVDTDARESGL